MGGETLADGENDLHPLSMWWAVLAASLLLFGAGALWMSHAPRRVVVKAKRDVTPYSVLTKDDLEELPGLSPDAGCVKSLADALKQVNVVAIKRGETLTEGMLLRPLPADMEGRRMFSVPLGGAPAPLAGEKVLLTAAKEGDAQSPAPSWEVIALGLAGERLVVVAPKDVADEIAARLLAGKSLLISRQLPTR